MRNPENLKVFQAADALAEKVYEWSAGLPPEEKYGLTSQMRRASVSVISNLAEGCSRDSAADFRRFVEMALGSAMELRAQMSLASRVHAGRVGPLVEANQLVQMLIGFLKGIRVEA